MIGFVYLYENKEKGVLIKNGIVWQKNVPLCIIKNYKTFSFVPLKKINTIIIPTPLEPIQVGKINDVEEIIIKSICRAYISMDLENYYEKVY